MSTLQIHERVAIQASVERVWAFLLDPARVVECLPGATFDGAESETVFLGHIKVKVGPVTTLFAGKATMAEIDAAAHRVRIVGEGKDKNGAGTARLEMVGQVVATDAGAELSVDADVDLAGKLVTFGRGLIKSVSEQMFKQFSARARAALEAEQAAAPAPPAPLAETPAEPAKPANPAPPAKPAEQEETLDALPLLLRAIGSSIAGFFRRLFRRKRAMS